jgi:hypothetical protein
MRIIPAASLQKPNGPASYTRVPKRVFQERLAREAAIERAMARYLRLDCGHMSTLETDLFYSHLRPKKGQTWCENCNDWVAISKPPAPTIYPDEPMF